MQMKRPTEFLGGRQGYIRATTSNAPSGILGGIGRTPLIELARFRDTRLRVWAKLEFCNPGGSSKARPAAKMIADALGSGLIAPGDTVVESSSGNMGIGLAQACARAGLRFICVTDTRANPTAIKTMRALGADVRVVSEPDPDTGDLLVARLHEVARLVGEIPGACWLDQYANASNPGAHATGTMREIDEALDGTVDYLFVATGTGGTLRGCLDYLDAAGRSTQVIAVDAIGSVLFGGERGGRKLPGMGAGRPSPLIEGLDPHRVEHVSEPDCVLHCRDLASREAIFAGASSGGVIAALNRIAPELPAGSRCACILPDSGTPYLDTVYDDEWVVRELGFVPSPATEVVGS